MRMIEHVGGKKMMISAIRKSSVGILSPFSAIPDLRYCGKSHTFINLSFKKCVELSA